MKIKETIQTLRKDILAVSAVLLAALLYFTFGINNYLLFHSIAEIFSVLVAFSTFLFAWNTRNIVKNHFFLFIGFALLFVGFTDFLHTLTFKGMNIFPGFDSNLPTQLWLAGRYLLALSFVIAPIFLYKKLNPLNTFLAFFLLEIILLSSIFHWKTFPVSYIEGSGLTAFKIFSEYIIISLFFLALILLYKSKRKLNKKTYLLLNMSLLFNILSELSFTLYFNVYDFFNAFGHIAKIISYYFIYKAIIEVGLTKPYSLLFRELNKLHEKKNEFINIASHELKSPITSIIIYSHLLKKGLSNKDKKNSKIIDKIQEQADNINSLINYLLDIGRMESDQLELQKSKFDFYTLTQKVIEDMQKSTKKHKIEFRGKKNAWVVADKERVSQILINLLTNAIKYSPDGGKIIVRMTKHAKKITVQIRDFGIGISENDQDKIFEKYYQIRKSNDTKSVGLGLYISKQLIKLHKGEMWVESKVSKGSSFYFSLPIT